jgi:hypothetical protein
MSGAVPLDYVANTTELFASHSYCSSARWFTTFELSYEYQGNDRGTAHPNRPGHEAFARHLDKAVVAHRERQPAYNARLVIEKVRWGTQLNIDERPYFRLRVPTRDDDLLTPSTVFHIAVAGELLRPAYDENMELLTELPTYNLPIYSKPQPRSFLTTVSFTLEGHRCQFSVTHGSSDSFGQGLHTLTAADGLCELHYRIELTRPDTVQH